jgi:penicillin-binding protein 2
MIVCLAAMEAGLATANTRISCTGHVDVGDTRFHCWHRIGHGELDMIGAIEQSCDVYLYEIAKKVGIDRINAMAHRFGLGEISGIDLSGERRGLIPSREWKLATLGTRWQVGETMNTGIGQGFVLATPLQLATMTARLANGGLAINPHIIAAHGVINDIPNMGLNAANLAVIRKSMRAVTMGARGTARKAALKIPDWEMAGKTGTVQVRRISLAERKAGITKNADRRWRDRDHALFVAFAPYDAPRYAIAVVVEHGGSGSSVAAPIARDVIAELHRLNPLGNRDQAGRAGLPAGRKG